MNAPDRLEALFASHGHANLTWFDPREFVVSQWVRVKCTFGCKGYGRCAACPPNTPTVEECREFFGEYRLAAILHFAAAIDPPEKRHAWSAEINRELLKLERSVFLAGYPKAFLLFMDNCSFCRECSANRETCLDAASARPSPEGMAIDVFATVAKAGLPIEVLDRYDAPMNRYAFLLIE